MMIHWRTRMTSPQIGAAHAVAVSIALEFTLPRAVFIRTAASFSVEYLLNFC